MGCCTFSERYDQRRREQTFGPEEIHKCWWAPQTPCFRNRYSNKVSHPKQKHVISPYDGVANVMVLACVMVLARVMELVCVRVLAQVMVKKKIYL